MNSVLVNELKKLAKEVLTPVVRQAVRDELAQQQQAESIPAQDLKSRQEVCDYLHISHPTFHAFVNKGLITPVKIGRKTFCDMNEIRQLVDAGRLGKYKHLGGLAR